MKVKVERRELNHEPRLTRQIACCCRRAEEVSRREAHASDVDALLPLVLALHVNHHLQQVDTHTVYSKCVCVAGQWEGLRAGKGGVATYGEPLLGVAHGQVGVVLPVADLRRAAAQFGRAAILAVVVLHRAVVDHGGDVGEGALQRRRRRKTGRDAKRTKQTGRSCDVQH